jgi:hypothetical protein
MGDWNIIHDVDPETPLDGAMALHCGKCLGELPYGQSPRSWSRQQAWITTKGYIQVWCNRHDCNITLMCIEAKKEGEDGRRNDVNEDAEGAT